MSVNLTSSALTAALRAIDRAFPRNHLARSMARTMIRVGPQHVATRARYGAIACDLVEHDASTDYRRAIAYVVQRRGMERRIHAVSADLNGGRSSRPMIDLHVLDEAARILRWLRRFQPQADIAAIIATSAIEEWSHRAHRRRLADSLNRY